MEFITPQPRLLKGAMTEHGRVIHALMLRDIKTRFGASYLGFIVGLLIPLAHITVLLVLFHVIGRRAPIGTDVTIFISTALVPFICWSYTHQKIVRSLADNRALLSFPIVKMIDIVIARAFVELMNSTLVVLVVYAALTLGGSHIFLFDPPRIIATLLTAYILGVSTGMVFALIILAVPGASIAAFLIIPLYWATSGNFFIPDALPAQITAAMAFFPLSHIVDFGRPGFYPEYTTSYHNMLYPLGVVLLNFLIFMSAQRFFKATLTTR